VLLVSFAKLFLLSFLSAILLACCVSAIADEPKPKPDNTVSVHLAEPVSVQRFENAPKFWITDVIDRSGNPQPMLVLKERGGIFLDKQPTVIIREALEQSLKAANFLAADANSADLVLRIYVFQFGLAQGSQLDFFGKVEFTAMVKNPKTGDSREVKAAGTSIAKGAMRKKNLQKNVQDDVEESLKDATRNFFHGQQLKDAVAELRKGADIVPAPQPPAKP
jgi:hypothetical protein